jgi:hypothetical protein
VLYALKEDTPLLLHLITRYFPPSSDLAQYRRLPRSSHPRARSLTHACRVVRVVCVVPCVRVRVVRVRSFVEGSGPKECGVESIESLGAQLKAKDASVEALLQELDAKFTPQPASIQRVIHTTVRHVVCRACVCHVVCRACRVTHKTIVGEQVGKGPHVVTDDALCLIDTATGLPKA